MRTFWRYQIEHRIVKLDVENGDIEDYSDNSPDGVVICPTNLLFRTYLFEQISIQTFYTAYIRLRGAILDSVSRFRQL